MTVDPTERMSNVRYQIVLVCIATAFILYLDRVCLGEIVKAQAFLEDSQLTKEQIGQFLGAFFFSYALFQVPAGWCSDRFGARSMLTLYILGWSFMTGLTGFMSSLGGLMLARFGCGIAQAGAYPTISATIRRWIRFARRGQASSFVSFGGRMGGTLAPFLTAIVMMYIGGWRQTLWLYAAVGVVIAIAYWWIVHDIPSRHPRCNELEQLHIGHSANERRPQLSDLPPLLWSCCKSRSLWLNSLGQFFINVGWAFLITWLPTYLKESQGMEDRQGALMVTIVLAMGMVGQPIGGWATDFSVKKLGLRLGRVLPISLACLCAACAYIGCTLVDSVWVIVGCCAVVSLMTDIGNPSTWAFMQDVGGRNTGAVFGWANMWGNLGAASSAIMVPYLMKYGEEGSGQHLVFYVCAGAFLLAGIFALGMDATKKLDQSRPQEEPDETPEASSD